MGSGPPNNLFRILVIDDNPAIHQDFIKVLSFKPADVTLSDLDEQLFGQGDAPLIDVQLPQFIIDSASQGQEGLTKVSAALKQGMPYALAFVDVRMPPGWDGIETIKRIWAVDSQIQIVICTAYSDYSWEETVGELGHRDNFLILKKPFDTVAVRQLATALTQKWYLARQQEETLKLLNQMVLQRTDSLQKSLAILQATFEATTDSILVTDLQGQVLHYNSQLANLWHLSDELLDRRNEEAILTAIYSRIKRPELFAEKVQELLENKKQSGECNLKLKSGQFIECCSHPYRMRKRIVGRLWSFRDITERTYLERKLEYQATHDLMTGLPNRILLLDRMVQNIAIAGRHRKQCAVLFFDLDRFKEVNDSMSHEIGDDLLAEVARRLSGLLREEDTLARLGGDEFIVFLPYLDDIKDVTRVADKLLAAFIHPYLLADRAINLATSIGIALFPDHGYSANDLICHADLAMYEAKKRGGQCYEFYDHHLGHKHQWSIHQQTDLQRGLKCGEFYLVYQPLFDITQQEIIAIETLLRWDHPEKGTLLPKDFIPLAEESGLIIELGEWVLEQAARQFGQWKSSGLGVDKITVNTSLRQLRQIQFPKRLAHILATQGMSPANLQLEISESILFANQDLRQVLAQLKAIGVSVVLDNFGIASTSMNYLKDVKVDGLKIDRSFVKNIHFSQSDKVIVEAIVAMAKSLNFHVVAEGVETESQCEFLNQFACDGLQGYFFCKPVRAEEMTRLLQEMQIKRA